MLQNGATTCQCCSAIVSRGYETGALSRYGSVIARMPREGAGKPVGAQTLAKRSHPPPSATKPPKKPPERRPRPDIVHSSVYLPEAVRFLRYQVRRLMPSASHGLMCMSEFSSYAALGLMPCARRLRSLCRRFLRLRSRARDRLFTSMLPMVVMASF